jgi:hypothetical protein
VASSLVSWTPTLLSQFPPEGKRRPRHPKMLKWKGSPGSSATFSTASVKSGKAQNEQMFSALPSVADRCAKHSIGSLVPLAVTIRDVENLLLAWLHYRAGLIDESCREPRRLRLACCIPAAGRVPQRMSDQTTLGQATPTAVQAEREPSSLMARNIRLPASTLEDRGQT